MHLLNFRFSFILYSFFWISISGFSQSNKFHETSEKIENLLKYKEKSPSQLRTLLSELKNYSLGNEASYNQLKMRVNNYLMPIEIKLARSDVYNRKFKEAVNKMKEIKINYSYDKDIEKLESYIDRKLFLYHKRTMLNHKSSWFSLEPSLSMYTSEVDLKDFTQVVNLNPVYGLGFYVKFNKNKKISSEKRTSFAFSQIGLKVDYRDVNYIVLKDTSSYFKASPYVNYQLSLLYRKTLGLDAGIVSYLNNGTFTNNYSLTGSFYIPIHFMSIGLNARLITDFKSPVPLFQLGGTLKFNIGVYKPFSLRDREEVKSQVFKFKEGK
jgi:hypothetical protein